jgi:preprotein translocase subunit SecD
MLKQALKIALLALILIAIIVVPLAGVTFYESPGLLTGGEILTNLKFGGGTSVYLGIADGADLTNQEEDLKKASEILEERFHAMGFSDTVVKTEDALVRVDLARKSYIDSTISEIATIGEWSFVGSDLSTPICNGSFVEDASVASNTNGSFGVTLHFTEDGAKNFSNNVADFALKGSNFYLMMDGQLMTAATAPDSEIRDTFTFGSFAYDSAIMIATFIKHGALPAQMQIEKTEALAPTLSKGILTAITVALAAALILLSVLILVKGRLAGIFGVAALISNIAIFTTALLNSSFMLNFYTLATMAILILIAAVIYMIALAPIGESFKEKKMISSSALAKLKSFNAKSIWIHAAIFAVALICFMFARGNFYYIVKAVITFSVSNFVLYFIFAVFGVQTLAQMKKN